ncbi:MAG: ImmA/IrrE family metallo-endopeptidase [Candidatus Omnitrophica bacterium]|nr:ImmA/IrrE family metallo-endopeptidase [Candidatus Omnitrophota bacterium]
MRSKKAIELIVKRIKEENDFKANVTTVDITLKLARLLNVLIYRQPLSEKIEAMVMPFLDGRYLMLVNDTKPLRRQIFSMAHELGHIALSHDLSSGDIFSFAIKDDDPETKRMDREADYFAAEFLIPAARLKSIVFSRPTDLNTLLRIFFVSKTAMNKRLSDLGLTDFVKGSKKITPDGNEAIDSQKIERGILWKEPLFR